MGEHLFVGIDGGGSKTRGVLARLRRDGPPEILAEWTAPPANWLGVPDANRLTAESMNEVCRNLARAAGGRPIAGAAAGMAGANLPDRRKTVLNCLREHFPFARCEVIGDAQAAYYGACPRDDAIVLISGTGSIAITRCGGRWMTAGGGGIILGDEGSGYWIGRMGLVAAIRAAESRGDATVLRERALRHYGVCSFDEVPARVHDQGGIQVSEVADFCGEVFAAAREGDRVARCILWDAGEELAGLAGSLLSRCSSREPLPVHLVGGVWRGRPPLIRPFTRRLWAGWGPVPIVSPLSQPAEGAAHFAGQILIGESL